MPSAASCGFIIDQKKPVFVAVSVSRIRRRAFMFCFYAAYCQISSLNTHQRREARTMAPARMRRAIKSFTIRIGVLLFCFFSFCLHYSRDRGEKQYPLPKFCEKSFRFAKNRATSFVGICPKGRGSPLFLSPVRKKTSVGGFFCPSSPKRVRIFPSRFDRFRTGKRVK